ncbi:MAG: hemerythrin domain-containing protein [Nonomuraea sp.]|nr:hemerythrin domain-containing protein [Nonomuraea sp.]
MEARKPTGTLLNDRITAFGTQLVQAHDWLREELARLRAGEAGSRDLRSHCLAFCDALTRHHTGEDETGFPALARQFPELRPVLDQLTRDHEMITEILQRVADDPAELDGLAAIMESHFVYEERKIVEALNALEWYGPVPDFLTPGAPPA